MSRNFPSCWIIGRVSFSEIKKEKKVQSFDYENNTILHLGKQFPSTNGSWKPEEEIEEEEEGGGISFLVVFVRKQEVKMGILPQG